MGVFLLQSAFSATSLIIVAVLVIVGWVVMYVASRRALKRAVDELRRDSAERIEVLEASVRAASPQPAMLISPAAPALTPTTGLSPVPPLRKEEKEEVTPEVLLVIAAAVTAFLGKKVRIRTAKLLQSSPEIYSAWAQQGRVFVQASHNLAQRGR